MARVDQKPSERFSFLTDEEAESLNAIARHLLYEDRDELIDFVVAHFDSQLSAGPGESERKVHLPPAGTLIRQGLAALDAAAKHLYWRRFVHCRTGQQFEMLAALQLGTLEPLPEWIGDSAKRPVQKAPFDRSGRVRLASQGLVGNGVRRPCVPPRLLPDRARRSRPLGTGCARLACIISREVR